MPTREEAEYSGAYVIEETDQACGLAEHGDSGGPVASGTYKGDATGILITGTHGSPYCSGGNEWVEQRIFTILNLFDVYVAAS